MAVDPELEAILGRARPWQIVFALAVLLPSALYVLLGVVALSHPEALEVEGVGLMLAVGVMALSAGVTGCVASAALLYSVTVSRPNRSRVVAWWAAAICQTSLIVGTALVFAVAVAAP